MLTSKLMMLDWLIIGGGVHGTAISFYLTQRKRVARDRIRVLDPYDEPLALWHHFTANTGMRYLRSPKVHNLHHDPWSIRTFAETAQGRSQAEFIPIYDRPSLAFFNHYSQWMIDKYDLTALRIIGRAQALKRTNTGWRVDTNNGTLEAKRIVLAMGTSEQPLWIDWADTLRQQQASIHHIFDRDFVRGDLSDLSDVVIIGGGISAAQIALTLTNEQQATVTILSPHDVKISHFDSDPCWVTRLCLGDFHAEPDFNKRRDMITQARAVGTMPSDVADALHEAIDAGRINFVVDEVQSARYDEGVISLRTTKQATYQSDCVILATGFESKRAGGQMIDDLIEAHNLPIADCGYPIVDQMLCWGEDIYVSGAFAELEIGPVARNIIGARLASERIGRVI